MTDNITPEIFFILGEEKYVKSRVYPADDSETVVISKGSFELRRLSDNAVEAAGSLLISGRDMKALISPLSTGRYILTETVAVGGETFIKKIKITVTEG